MFRNTLRTFLIHMVLILTTITTVLPFYWMVATSLKTDEKVMKMPPDYVPNPLNLENYTKIFEAAPMGLAFLNSIKITVIVTAGILFTCSLAAYAFSKINFKGSSSIFGVFIGTMMIPVQVTLIPLYIIFKSIGWIDTHLPLIVPYVLLNAYGIFLIKQFMVTIPDSYVESAKIDGCNHFLIYWRIMLPLCKPAVVTLGLFSFIGHWNNFLPQLIFLSSDTKFTIPLIISSFKDIYTVQWGLLMAASTVSIIPIAIMYLFSQKFFIEGIALSGVKA